MNSIEEMNNACIILDLIDAPKMQVVFVKKEDFEERYGFVIPSQTKGHFHWISVGDDQKIDVIATIQINGYSFNFIDPTQINPKTSI